MQKTAAISDINGCMTHIHSHLYEHKKPKQMWNWVNWAIAVQNILQSLQTDRHIDNFPSQRKSSFSSQQGKLKAICYMPNHINN